MFVHFYRELISMVHHNGFLNKIVHYAHDFCGYGFPLIFVAMLRIPVRAAEGAEKEEEGAELISLAEN